MKNAFFVFIRLLLLLVLLIFETSVAAIANYIVVEHCYLCLLLLSSIYVRSSLDLSVIGFAILFYYC